MKARRLAQSGVCLLAIVVLANNVVHADMDAGERLYESCVACHGDKGEGNPALNSPAIGGQAEAYISRQLRNFKSGLRGSGPEDSLGAQMRGMAALLKDEQAIAEISSYIAALTPTQVVDTASGDLRNGNNIYQGNCGACHGGRAQGNPALDAPRLNGLDTGYFIRQMAHFRDGVRGADKRDRLGRQMSLMARTLEDEQSLRDVIAYIQAQTP